MSTKQEVFDKVLKFMRKQGKQSKSRGECKYRGPGGLKCAVGCLITEKQIKTHKVVEGTQASKLPNALVREMVGSMKNAEWFLNDLQNAHDAADRNFPSEFEERMHDVAERWGLKYNAK